MPHAELVAGDIALSNITALVELPGQWGRQTLIKILHKHIITNYDEGLGKSIGR